MGSVFLNPHLRSDLGDLALLHLRRDQTIPTILQLQDEENQGYKEGKVTNTRFGSFPHSTLIDQPWGSQIVASIVDTGSRGRKPNQKLKRKAADLESPTPTNKDEAQSSPGTPVAAASGFLHLLYPTPELWTASLPHRTQVVYTPDYSYILHRLCVRPGCTILEAGAGSGSFTHASVRAVFNGYPSDAPPAKKRRLGKVCSFEFHAQRAQRVREEIHEHGLDGLVEVTHRDVYKDGFLLGDPATGKSPKANAIFLDLPAPWLALKHLVRNPPSGAESPLDPSSPVYICTFSPCLEQAQRTISTLRQYSWLSISMVEVQHHRIDVKRERCGLDCEGVRGAMVFPKSVDEAVAKMRVVEENSRKFRESRQQDSDNDNDDDEPTPSAGRVKKAEADERPIRDIPLHSTAPASSTPAYDLGRVVHRTEPDLKTHTSYLVFAILPRDWTEEDEQRCRQAWPSQQVGGSPDAGKPKGKRQLKREAKELEAQDQKAEKSAEASASQSQSQSQS
ncbi:tRNA 1-methyladenosine methyltransferase subunit GCD14 [Aspergillus clavatus NRRL 1]|uniref:tRNA (adenine(58)-N(1))-methyltransferase catalytic subunit TRM61 n=1 Tax=Aspergillus clavatus (strain ATCC 1007 / CBS 513.65 / DSM 816 / NCTC 3887 / NRRL 1 / QM 1276 / 107) TaxID=344612 RepID=A1CA97_ASPCL|nr:tRNA methyltransferase subunit GCD14, putative [Aspergillus clavatus NRRL 1]EAW12665.1 tRNA methyltransferase subunit GCD14, putative [Aspergillus clavatus NRRL 1]